MKPILMLGLMLVSSLAFASDQLTPVTKTEIKAVNPSEPSKAEWYTTTSTTTCPDGSTAVASCQFWVPGGGSACDGGCSPTAWATCTCW